MPVVPVLIAGLILRFADNPEWFRGAHMVGDILIVVAVGFMAVLLLLAGSLGTGGRY